MNDPQREIANLRRILEVTRVMASTMDLHTLLGQIIETTCEVLDCERATIFLYDRVTNELYSRIAKDAEGIRFPADRGIAGAAAQERICVNVPDAYADSRFNPEVDRRTGFTTRNLLTFPLENLSGELIGVLQALNKRGGAFEGDDEELARVLSAQAGVALDRGRLLEEYAEKQRMARDLQIARSIQEQLFPSEHPRVAGYEVAGWNRAADECGGDSYDFVPLPDGRLLVVLADATGHGIGAALVIAQSHALVRGLLQVTQDITRICAGMNTVLAHDLDDGRFVTAFIGILDAQRHSIEYVSCGQAPLLMIRGESVEVRHATSVPLAVVEDTAFTPHTFEFGPGDTLVLLTDGFYETTNIQEELYGEKRVIELVQKHRGEPPEKIISELHGELQRFSAHEPQADDLTAVLIRRSS